MDLMHNVNPAGTMFLGLVDQLIDLTGDPNVSKIEIAMASYEPNNNEEKQDKQSIAIRSFVVNGMNKEIQEQIRQQFDAKPLTHLMILWKERFENENKLGIYIFDPLTSQQADNRSSYDPIEKAAISGYLQH
jgi:hypothetical protein